MNIIIAPTIAQTLLAFKPTAPKNAGKATIKNKPSHNRNSDILLKIKNKIILLPKVYKITKPTKLLLLLQILAFFLIKK